MGKQLFTELKKLHLVPVLLVKVVQYFEIVHKMYRKSASSKQRYNNAVTPLIKLLFSIVNLVSNLIILSSSYLSVSECLSVCLLCSVYVCFCVSYVWRLSVSRLLSGSCHCLKSCSVSTLRNGYYCNLELDQFPLWAHAVMEMQWKCL